MINGSGDLHWCTFYDEDDEPYGETCRCPIGEDHEEDDLPAGTEVPVTPVLSDEEWAAALGREGS